MALNIPENSAEIRTAFLGDIELGARENGVTDPPIEPGSDWHNLGTAVANVALIQNQNVAIAERDSSELTAEDEALDQLRIQNGLPELVAQGSTGWVKLGITGEATIVVGSEAVAKKNGLRYSAITTTTNPSDGQEIEMEALDTGVETNLASGEILTWANPPPNVNSQVTVSNTIPFLGGRDKETDQEKQERISERKKNPPASGNWSQVVEIAEGALPSVQGAYVYPALGGPSSYKVVITKAFFPEDDDYSRVPSDGMLRIVRDEVNEQLPDGNANVYQSVAEEDVDVSISVDIPDSAGAGGSGRGWINDVPWPPLVSSETNVRVSATPTSTTTIKLDANTTTAPVAGQTRIAWWSQYTKSFYQRLVVSYSGSSGAWFVTVDRPLVDDLGNQVALLDYVCPASVNLANYGESWLDIMSRLGPGENTSGINLPRSKRRPYTDARDSPQIGSPMLRELQSLYDEIFDLELTGTSPSDTPSVPSSVDDAPNVLALRHFGIYPL
jgi:uncharacterized phage protein gp47/JayE